MTTIKLKAELAEQIEQLTGKGQSQAEAFVEKAVRSYILLYRREKIRVETKAFNQQIDELRQKYPGQFVAIHHELVIDHDLDLRTLHLRVHDKMGNIPILLKQITDKPERELVFRSPRFHRNNT